MYIKATPQAVWEAITTPEWTSRYGKGGVVEYDLRPGGAYRAYPGEAMKRKAAEMGFPLPEAAFDGEVIEADPPRRLVHTFRMLIGDEAATAEGFTRLTWEIDEVQPGVSKLTVIHDTEGAPIMAAQSSGEMEGKGAGGGWNYVLSDLKSLLETGQSLRG
ncbi:MAG: SRPBCC domain-containing protein [Actinomycetota bacterium]|nr:SRPBCC domain-containing protein [Actinomycetota bacterium]